MTIAILSIGVAFLFTVALIRLFGSRRREIDSMRDEEPFVDGDARLEEVMTPEDLK